MLKKGEGSKFFFGFEESNGFLFSPFVREKDGISTSLLIASMAALYKSKGMDLIDKLDELGEKYGVLYERPRSYNFLGISGKETMERIMDYFRQEQVESIGSEAIKERIDYLSEDTGFPKSNIIEYLLEDGSRVIIRPSGTEPKIKVYAYLTSPKAPVMEEINNIMNEYKTN